MSGEAASCCCGSVSIDMLCGISRDFLQRSFGWHIQVVQRMLAQISQSGYVLKKHLRGETSLLCLLRPMGHRRIVTFQYYLHQITGKLLVI